MKQKVYRTNDLANSVKLFVELDMVKMAENICGFTTKTNEHPITGTNESDNESEKSESEKS